MSPRSQAKILLGLPLYLIQGWEEDLRRGDEADKVSWYLSCGGDKLGECLLSWMRRQGWDTTTLRRGGAGHDTTFLDFGKELIESCLVSTT